MALGEMPGWVLGSKVPVSRLGLLGLPSLLAWGGFAAMWYQVQELGALRVGPLEGCPTSLEPDSESQRTGLKVKSGSRKGREETLASSHVWPLR